MTVLKRERVNWTDIASIALIVAGAGLRIHQWLLNRSLWIDESSLAVNVIERGFGELHKPLEYSQSAPYLFLVASKAMVSLFGSSELALRCLPLTASIASLWMFWMLAKECLARWTVPFAVALFVFAYQPFYYAQELKQYSLELFTTTLVLWMAARLFTAGPTSKSWFVMVAAVGFVGVFLMHSMPFLLAGVGLTAAWMKWRQKLDVSYVALGIAAAAWIGAFALNYIIFIRHNYADHVMKSYWAFAYPGKPWTLSGLRDWFVLVNGYLWYFGYKHILKILFCGLIAMGCWVSFRRERWLAIAGAIAIGAYGLAASAGLAPFYGRLILWMFPVLIVIASCAVSALAERRRLLGITVAGMLLWPSIADARKLIAPIEVEGIREVAQRLSHERRPDEPIYVFVWAQPGLRYYQRQFPNLSDGLVLGRDYTRMRQHRETPPSSELDLLKLLPEINDVDPTNGFWILLDHLYQPQEAELLSKLHLQTGLRPLRSYGYLKTSIHYFGPHR